MELLELLKARYSVRRFADKPVEEEKLQLVLEAGACAPTAKNQQPQHIYVLESAAALEKIRAITPCAFDAPVVLLICGDRQEGWTNPFNDRNATEMDCSIVTAQMMLEAQSLGLGTTWCGLLYWCLQLMLPELLPELGLPETHSFQYAMLLGEPAIRYARTVEYGPATVHRIQWK